jgi:GNAT superfamily N-acetyltransferase
MIKISVMEYADLAYAKSLTDIESWGHQESDFRRLLELDPQGSFVAWYEDERAGIATTISYGQHSFLGNIIVEKQRRGRNIGPALMQHAIDYLDGKGMRTIELDGVLPAVTMYRHMGFHEKYRSLRLVREPTYRFHAPHTVPRCEEPSTLIEFDFQQTGIERQALIRRLAAEFPASTFCLGAPRLEAYAVVRERAHGVLAIGPLVAQHRTACKTMMQGIVSIFGDRKIAIGVPEINKVAVEIMLQHGFRHGAPSLRMFRGPSIDYEEHVYGIASADVG